MNTKSIQLKELKKAFKIIWILASLFSIVILVIVFLCKDISVLSKIPICEFQAENKKCFLCGSSRAFFEIKKLKFIHAYHLNKVSIVIFGIMLFNSLFFLTKMFKNK